MQIRRDTNFATSPLDRETSLKKIAATQENARIKKNRRKEKETICIYFFKEVQCSQNQKKIKNKGPKRSSLAGNRTRGGRVRADRVTDYTTRDQLNEAEKFWFLTLPFMHFVQKGPKSHEAVGNLPKEIRQRGNNFLGGEENCWLRNTPAIFGKGASGIV